MGLTCQLSRLQSNKGLLGLAIVMFLTICVPVQLYPTFDSYFIADDFAWLSFAKNDQSILSAALHPGVHGGWTTPVTNVIFWVWFRAFGFDPRGYYLMIALIHLFNSWLVYDLTHLVTRRVGVAYGSASIFALHFMHFSDWGSLVWISAFIHVVMGSFYLLSLAFFVRYLYFRTRRSYIGALVCAGLALASKEAAVTLPLLLLTWYLIGSSPAERRFTRAAIVLAPFWTVLAVYLLYKLLTQQTSDRYFEVGVYGFGYHLISNWKYFSNLVMPNPQSPPVHSYLLRTFPSWTLSLAYLAASLTRLGLIVAGVTLWRKGAEHVRLWIALSLITYLPFIAFAGGNAGANRYFYLPAIGFSALAAEGLAWMYGRAARQRRAVLSTCLLTMTLLGFWVCNLLPIRAWQKEMRATSQPVQQAIHTVGEYVAKQAAPIANVYLIGFPSSATRYVQRAIRLVYSADRVLVVPEQKDETELPMDTLVLVYEANRVVLRQP